jgi:hypothetical protein
MPNVGLTKVQAEALNRHLACGRPSNNGLFLSALQNGLIENFQGKSLLNYVRTDTGGGDDTDVATYSFLSIDGDLDPYYIDGASQLMAIRGSDATAVSAAGLVIASTSTPAALRLTCRDANGANVVGVSQEGALWIPSSAAWTAQFEAIVPKNAYVVGVAFQEIGFFGAGDIATHFIDASKEFGYVDGTSDAPFVSLKFYNGSGYLRVRGATGGTVVTSGAFVIPSSGKHAYRLEYGYASSGGTPAVALFLDDVFVTSVTVTIGTAMQFAARACHGASYVAATHTPPVIDVNSVLVAVHSA